MASSPPFALRLLLIWMTCLQAVFPFSVHSFAPLALKSTPACASLVQGIPRRQITTAHISRDSSVKHILVLSHSTSKEGSETGESDGSLRTRRAVLSQAVTAGALPMLALTQAPSAAHATDKPPPIVPPSEIARRLRRVPVFALVDGNGIPFHTYDKDSAGGNGYFFLSYESATYVLDDAKKAFAKAKKEAIEKRESAGEGAISDDGSGDVPDSWGQAQIVALPLDYAVQLTVKKTSSVALNGKGRNFNTYYQVIPLTDDLDSALKIENGPRFSERGRVPLFYIDGLQLASNDGGTATSPTYFRAKDLVAEWKNQHPNDEQVPIIRVRELSETFRAMLRPGGKDETVRNLVFIPNAEMVKKAAECLKTYKLGEMIMTQ